MALIKSCLAAGAGGALSSGTYVRFNDTGFLSQTSYTDGTAVRINSNSTVSGVIFGVAGKSSLIANGSGFMLKIKPDGTTADVSVSANVSVDISNSSEVVFFNAPNAPNIDITIS